MKFNPFDHLVEGGHDRWKKISNSSLRERFKDTYKAFNGVDQDKNHFKMGILDYIFPIPALLGNISESIFNSIEKDTSKYKNYLIAEDLVWPLKLNPAINPPISKPNSFFLAFRYVAGYMFLAPSRLLGAFKALVSLTLTVALSPLIAIAHLCLHKDDERTLNIKRLNKGVAKLKVDVIPESTSSERGANYRLGSRIEKKTLNNLIKDSNKTTPGKKATYKIKPYVLITDRANRAVWTKFKNEESYCVYSEGTKTRSLAIVKSISGDKSKTKVVGHINLDLAENKIGIEGLIELNLFKTREGLRKAYSMEAIKKMCGIKNK
jgi:hypothetical protein